MAIAPNKRLADHVFGKAQAAGQQYVTVVEKGALNVEQHTEFLNRAFGLGYRLHSIFEQRDNTVMVFERWR